MGIFSKFLDSFMVYFFHYGVKKLAEIVGNTK